MNAVMEQRRDKHNHTSKYAKLSMAEQITAHQYRDEWRLQTRDTIDYTWKRSDKQARLDYIFVNEKFKRTQMTPDCKARILAKQSDHNTISIEYSLKHRQPKEREPRPRFQRVIPEEILKTTLAQIKVISEDHARSPLERFERFEDTMQQLNRDHLTIKPPAPKTTIPFKIQNMTKALANVEKLVRNLEQLDRNDKDGIRYIRTAAQRPATHNYGTALENAARRLHKMQTLHAALFDTTTPHANSPRKWIRDLEKRVTALRRTIQQLKKREERRHIRKHIEKLIKAHESDPKTFWRKMKPQGTSKSLWRWK